ncbi:DUF4159 domain-containing protein [Gemmatimonas sp.]
MKRWRPLFAASVLLVAATTLAWSQRFRTFVEPNVAYDGRFTFVRLRYTERGPSGWSFDYPAMERNFMTIVQDLTAMRTHVRRSNVHRMDDTLLSRYPIAYLSEPGYWYPDEQEAAGLRAWLQKGGFLIVDDFLLRQWDVFSRSMREVLPDAQFIRLDRTHPIFNAFFSIGTLEGLHHPSSRNAKAEYYGIFENNDPKGRLMVIVNFNNDIGDYMEWSGQGWYAVNLTNDAYKFATNYLVYALTH